MAVWWPRYTPSLPVYHDVLITSHTLPHNTSISSIVNFLSHPSIIEEQVGGKRTAQKFNKETDMNVPGLMDITDASDHLRRRCH